MDELGLKTLRSLRNMLLQDTELDDPELIRKLEIVDEIERKMDAKD